jgi:hypothetical protein
MREPDRDAIARRLKPKPKSTLSFNPKVKLDTSQVKDSRDNSDINWLLFGQPHFSHPRGRQAPVGLEDYISLSPATMQNVRDARKRKKS